MKFLVPFFLVLFGLSSCVNDTTQAQLTCSADNPVSWSRDVKVLFETKCAITGCHPSNSSYQVSLETYEQVNANTIYIKPQVVDRIMPRGTPLTDKELFLITCWIDQGALQN